MKDKYNIDLEKIWKQDPDYILDFIPDKIKKEIINSYKED